MGHAQIHMNPWRPNVRASVLGPAPRPRTGSAYHSRVVDPTLMIQLGADGRARNRMQFDPRAYEKIRKDDPVSGPGGCQLYMWKHTEGSVVHEEVRHPVTVK